MTDPAENHHSGKVRSMAGAVADLVADGDQIALGLSLESAIPFAVGHEIVRQGRRDLTLIGPISDLLFDLMIGGGAVAKVKAAWVGNVSTGLGYNFRRAVEQGAVEMVDYSNYSVALALRAAAEGLPFALTKSLLGSDILARNPDLTELDCPFTGQKLVAVQALRPDLAVVHVQRADAQGNAQLWGATGVTLEAVRAARRVLVVCEELVEAEVIRSDPNRTLIPGFLTTAVVHQPWGAHPAGLQGCYAHDDQFYLDYAARTKDRDSAQAWLKEWVLDVADQAGYLAKLGPERLAGLRMHRSAPAEKVDYGY